MTKDVTSRAMLQAPPIWALIAGIVILNALAQTLLKLGAGQGIPNLPLLGGVIVYGLSTLLYVMVLARANLSFAYPVVIGLTAIVTCFAGARLFGERIGALHWVGITLVIAGVALLATTRNGAA